MLFEGRLLIKKYFEQHDLARHAIESFNDFIDYGLQRVVNDVGGFVPDILPPGVESFEVKFGKIRVEKPMHVEPTGAVRRIYPIEARLRNLTYAGHIYLEMIPVKNGEEQEREVVYIGNLPVMVKSKLCYLSELSEEDLIKLGEDPDDPGGYFIIGGNERILILIEDLYPNRVFLEKGGSTSSIECSAKVFSEGRERVMHVFEKDREGIIYVTFAGLKRVPFVVLLRALGIERDEDIYRMIGLGEEYFVDIYVNILEVENIRTREDAYDYLGAKMGVTSPERRKERARYILNRFLLPHIGSTPREDILKAWYIAKVVRRLILFSHGKLEPIEKDHYMNKKVRTAGELMEMLFRYFFNMLVEDMKYNFEKLAKRKRFPSMQAIVRPQYFTSKLESAMATGRWPQGERTGVSQLFEKHNHLAYLSYLRKLVSPIDPERENVEVREVHPTHWGRICVIETPDSRKVGLTRHLALLAETSRELPEDKLRDLIRKLEELGVELVDPGVKENVGRFY